MGNHTNRREQTKKVNKHEDKAWMRARLDQSNSNLTRPGGNKPRNRAADKRSWKAGL